MKYLSLMFLFFMLNFTSQAQNRTDSLEMHLKNHFKEDTARVRLLHDICREYIDLDNQKLEQYAKVMLRLSEKINYNAGKADALNFLGVVKDIDSDYAKALAYYSKALVLAKKSKSERTIASVNNNIGLIKWKTGDLKQALSYFFDALKQAEKIGSIKLQGNISSNIGLVLQDLKRYNEALEWQKKALAIRLKKKDDYGLASTYTNLATIYSFLAKPDSSIIYQKKAISLQKEIKDNYGLGISYLNLGAEYKILKQNQEALKYYLLSKNIRESIDDELGLSFTYMSLATVYNNLGDNNKAIYYGEKSLAIAKKIKSDERIAENSKGLADIYRETGNLTKAFNLLQQYTSYHEKVFDQEMNRKVSELNVKYEVENKNLMLKQNKLVMQNQFLTIKRNNWMIFSGIAIFLVSGLLVYLLYTRYQTKQQTILQNEILVQQDLATKAVIEAEENERVRIANDLHDGIGQLFSTVKMNLSGIEDQLSFQDDRTRYNFENTLQLVDESCREVRNISHQMAPNILLKTGLVSAIRDFILKVDEHRLKINLEVDGLSERLELHTETVLFRVIQESVNNVIKHAKATLLDIQLVKDEEGLSVMIEDNGQGFNLSRLNKFEGMGLRNMRTRVEYLKGKIDFDSSEGKGTVVSIWLPVTDSKLS